jgi:hypothetical protein
LALAPDWPSLRPPLPSFVRVRVLLSWLRLLQRDLDFAGASAITKAPKRQA